MTDKYIATQNQAKDNFAPGVGAPEQNLGGKAIKELFSLPEKLEVTTGTSKEMKMGVLSTTESLENEISSTVDTITREHLNRLGDTCLSLGARIDDAMKSILQSPVWDRRFRDDVRASDQRLRQHPQIEQEIRDAAKKHLRTVELAAGSEKVYSKEFEKLPKDVQNRVLSEHENRDLRDFLRKNHPSFLDASDDHNEIKRMLQEQVSHLSNLDRIQQAPVDARMAQARFLLQRGNQGDQVAAITLLGQIAQNSSSVVRNEHYANRMTELIKASGALDDPVFRQILKDNNLEGHFQGGDKDKRTRPSKSVFGDLRQLREAGILPELEISNKQP